MPQNIPGPADVIPGKEDADALYVFKDVPAFFGCTTAPRARDQKADRHGYSSRASGCVQLNPLLPLSMLYMAAHGSGNCISLQAYIAGEYMAAHGSGNIGKTWAEHHKTFARSIKKFNNSTMLEIDEGGGGAFSREYHRFHSGTAWTMADPAPVPLEGVRAR